MATANPRWSYSSIKMYDQCPKKYFHIRIAKDVKDEQNVEHLIYGKEFHKAAEDYVSGAAPLPERFRYAKSALDNLKACPGRVLCEYEMGLTAKLEPCTFDAPDCWWRGVADLIIIEDDGTARVLDYKTGASAKYADKGQLELMALAVFKHFPEVKRVKAALLFVVAKAFIKENYHRDDEAKLWSKWLAEYAKMRRSYELGVWNPRTSGLCKKHCVVLSCLHNGRNA
jgi:hypothetical protein